MNKVLPMVIMNQMPNPFNAQQQIMQQVQMKMQPVVQMVSGQQMTVMGQPVMGQAKFY